MILDTILAIEEIAKDFTISDIDKTIIDEHWKEGFRLLVKRLTRQTKFKKIYLLLTLRESKEQGTL